MKKLLFLFGFIFLLNCNAIGGDEFEIKGSIKNAKQSTIFIEKMSHSELKLIDSCQISPKGEFKLKGNIDGIGFYRLMLKDPAFPQGISVFLTLDKNEKVAASIDLNNMSTNSITSNENQKEFQDMIKNFNSQQNEIMQLYQQYQSIAKSNPKATDAQSIATMIQSKSEHLNSYLDNILKTAKNPITKYYLFSVILEQLKNQDPNPEIVKSIKSFSEELNKSMPKSVYALDFQKLVEKTEAKSMQKQPVGSLEIGAMAPDIDLINDKDQKVKLSSFRGKTVLMDFWASWCRPCRMENPNVLKAFNLFKNKGFVVLSISQDQDLDKWKDAIAKDGLIWPTHFADKKSNMQASSAYDIQYIPKTYLIDKTGKIVGKDLRGEALEIELQKLLK